MFLIAVLACGLQLAGIYRVRRCQSNDVQNLAFLETSLYNVVQFIFLYGAQLQNHWCDTNARGPFPKTNIADHYINLPTLASHPMI